MGVCRHCRDAYDQWTCRVCGKKPQQECPACHGEAAHGLPPSSDIMESSLPPPHKGLTERQRWGLRKTDGG